MTQRVEASGLQVASQLYSFINDEALPEPGLPRTISGRRSPGSLPICLRATPRCSISANLQTQIDAWHQERKDQPLDLDASRQFLEEICYLVPEGAAFSVSTSDVDPETSEIAGPQLVVPVMNARRQEAKAKYGQ